MNFKNNNYFIPVLTSEAGMCLTLANWQEIGIKMVSYYLDALLMKPGLSLLNALAGLRSYCGWQGSLVLNASLLKANEQGIFTIRSRFDGSLISLNQTELLSLIVKLEPDLVILSNDVARCINLSEWFLARNSTVFITGDAVLSDSESAALGNYWSYSCGTAFADFMQLLRKSTKKTSYVAGEFDLLQAQELTKQGVFLLESDKPAADAIIGQIYTHQGNIALLDEQMAQQHEPLDSECGCPTCVQGLTRAYLHHLLLQTPLLAQRFLIHHNVYYYSYCILKIVSGQRDPSLCSG